MISLWRGKVKRRVRLGEPVFADLRRRGEVSEPDLPTINVPGWQACRDGQHVSFMRMEDWCLDGQRTVTEIKRHDDQPTGAVYVIESHGCKITNDYFTSPKLGQLTKSNKLNNKFKS